MRKVLIDKDRCTLCGLCVSLCVRGIIEEGEGTAVVTDPESCILCGHCKAVCAVDAPQLSSLDEGEFKSAPAVKPDPEGLLDFFRSRRSMRMFMERRVERDKLEKMIQAGRYAPTGGNRQGIHYTVVHTPERLHDIREMNMALLVDQADKIEKGIKSSEAKGDALSPVQVARSAYIDRWRKFPELLADGDDRLFYNAPALMVLHLNPSHSTSPLVDAGLASMQMVLMAETLGLGTCFCGFFVFAVSESAAFKKDLGIPEGHVVPVAFMVGYPSVKYPRLVARNPARVNWI